MHGETVSVSEFKNILLHPDKGNYQLLLYALELMRMGGFW